MQARQTGQCKPRPGSPTCSDFPSLFKAAPDGAARPVSMQPQVLARGVRPPAGPRALTRRGDGWIPRPVISPQKLKFVIAFAVVAGGVVFLMAGKLKSAFRYSETVTAVAQGGEALAGRSLRIQAQYVDDSLVKKREGGKPFFEFTIAEGTSRLTVRYDDSPPDTLVNGAQVTAEGQVTRAGYFTATKVFAKCPSKYEAMQTPAGYKPPDPYSAAGRGVKQHPKDIPLPVPLPMPPPTAP